MLRVAFALMAVALLLAPASAEEPGKEKPTVELAGDMKDEALQKEAPADGVIASEKGWEKLAKAWGITDAPKVDFAKEILIVGTWRGSTFNITSTVKDGDLTVFVGGPKDVREGFRWKIASIKRDGIKTVKGKALPKE